jgi:ATP-dependent RNA helicase SUPV3L1/SUV3
LKPQALAFAQGFVPAAWRPPSDRISPLPDGVTPGALSAFGLRAVGGHAVPVEALERLDALLRAAPRQGQGAVFSDQAREELGWSEGEARAVLKGLNFAPSAKPKLGEPVAWRRRNEKPERAETRPAPAHSPFAALAALKDKPAPARRPRRRRKPKQAQA